MKNFNLRLVCIVVIQFFILHSNVYSQFGVVGETVRGSISRRIDRGAYENIHHLTYTAKIFQITTTTVILFSGDASTDIWGEAPPEIEIVSANFKSDNPDIVFVLFSDGSVMVVSWKASQFGGGRWEYSLKDRKKIFTASNYPFFRKIIGDAIYVLETGNVYASWDTAKTWKLDTTGLQGNYVTDVSVDTNHYGWAATIDGLFIQHPDSTLWRRIESFPSNDDYCQAIFVDRRNRIFVSTGSSVYFSTDVGASWKKIMTGFSGIVTSFGDDAFGNIYASTNDKAYRLSQLTPPWVNVSDSMASLGVLHSNTKLINSIGGDTIVFAATKYGLLESIDSGFTWKYSHAQLPAFQFYGIVRTGNYFLVSTNLGIYRCADGDSLWEKVFPQDRFTFGINAITSDSAGVVYGNFPFPVNSFTSVFHTVTSTNYGATWTLDTAGQKALGINSSTQSFDLFVDNQGTQYLGGNAKLYSKKPGHSWMLDTAGIGLLSNQFIADVSLNNRKGITYLARKKGTFPNFSFAMYQKGKEDTAWQVMNTGLLTANEGRIISDHEGNIILRTLSFPYKMWKFVDSIWLQIPLPTGIGSSPFPIHISVDRSGNLWGAFVGSGVNKGLYYSTNNGILWTYAGLNGVGINFLRTVDDTVYAVTFIDGIHGFTATSSPMSAENSTRRIVASYELFHNYPNPFNPSTTISFAIPVSGFVSIKVHDMLGREVAELLHEDLNEGVHSVLFDASALSTGVYIYTLTAGNFHIAKKLLLIK
ncbi:MAG: T9SS type A sorting domain-containing protein [Bacteroidetes bacterium]|nr:T9SS type A sorting domain-containing protein [Bacteroidota bacterium]